MRGLLLLCLAVPAHAGLVPNDHFIDAAPMPIGGVPEDTEAATREMGEPQHAGDPGGASVWYRWSTPVAGQVVVETQNARFDTLLAVYTGNNLLQLVPVAANNDRAPGDTASRVAFMAAPGVEYHIALDGRAGDRGKCDLFLDFVAAAAPPPHDHRANAIEGQAGGVAFTDNELATVEPGEDAHGGGATIWYRFTLPERTRQATFRTAGSAIDTFLAVYRADGVLVGFNDDFGGQPTSEVTVEGRPGDEFFIQIGGMGGAQGRITFEITVPPPPMGPPPHDAFAEAVELVEGGAWEDNNFFCGLEPDEPAHTPDPHGASLWYRWTADADGPVTFSVLSRDFGPVLAVYSGEILSDLAALAHGTGIHPHARFEAVAGESYAIAVASYFARQGDFELRWARPPANDDLADAEPLFGPVGSVPGTTLGATHEPGEADHFGGHGDGSVWFDWTAPADGVTSFSLSDHDFTAIVGLYEGNDFNQLRAVAGRFGQVSVVVTAGRRYRIVVEGAGGGSGPFTLSWAAVPPPANDDRADATPIAGPTGRVDGNIFGATHEPDEPAHGGELGSVWWRWVAPASGRFTFVTYAGFRPLLAIYEGGADVAHSEPYLPVNFRDLEQDARAAVEAVAGRTYLIAVDGLGQNRNRLTLRWTPAPANDDFADAAVIEGEAGVQEETLEGATREPLDPSHLGARYDAPATVWYRFTAPRDGAYDFDARGSLRPVHFALFTEEPGGLERVAEGGSNLISLGVGHEVVHFVAQAGATYFLQVDNACIPTVAGIECSVDGGFRLNWRFLAPPPGDVFAAPLLIEGPSGDRELSLDGATREAGEPDHAGVPGLASVWLRWVAPADGRYTFDVVQILSRFHLLGVYTGASVDRLQPVPRSREPGPLPPPAGPDDLRKGVYTFDARAGTPYHIALDAELAATLQVPYRLRWDVAPSNDTRAAAVDLPGWLGSTGGTLRGATVEPDEAWPWATIWYRWTAPDDGIIRFRFYGDWVPELAVESDAGPVEPYELGDGIVAFRAVAGRTYHLTVAGVFWIDEGLFFVGFGGAEVFPLDVLWEPVPLNNRLADAQAIGGLAGQVEGTTRYANREPGEPAHLGRVGSASVWYRWTAPAPGVYRFWTEGDFVEILGIYDTRDFNTMRQVEDAELGLGPAGTTGVAAVAGQTFYLAVDGEQETSGDFTLHWSRPLPRVQIGDVFPETEGVMAAAGAGFLVALTVPAAEPTTVELVTRDGTARAPGDYTATRTLVRFAPGDRDLVVFVPVNNDRRDEPTETFHADLENPNGCEILRRTGTATLRDDDAPPRLTISDTRAPRGGLAHFTLELSAPSDLPVKATLTTRDGTARAPRDYTPRTTTLTFPPGTTRQTFSVPIRFGPLGRTFTARITHARNATTLADREGLATIGK